MGRETPETIWLARWVRRGLRCWCIPGRREPGQVFNALDEFACPAVGAIRAAAGVLIGSLVK